MALRAQIGPPPPTKNPGSLAGQRSMVAAKLSNLSNGQRADYRSANLQSLIPANDVPPVSRACLERAHG